MALHGSILTQNYSLQQLGNTRAKMQRTRETHALASEILAIISLAPRVLRYLVSGYPPFDNEAQGDSNRPRWVTLYVILQACKRPPLRISQGEDERGIYMLTIIPRN